MRVTKLEAASRQLDTAIRLLFHQGDAVAVHSLAAAAANVFFDVAEEKAGVSWRTKLRDDSGLPMRELVGVLHRSWNFFKHANRDAADVIEFDERDSEHLMFIAVLDAGDLQPTTHSMQVFQLWYMAAYLTHLAEREPVFKHAASVLPGLSVLDREAQLARGAALLRSQPGI